MSAASGERSASRPASGADSRPSASRRRIFPGSLSVISMLPLMVVYLAAQRWFIEGLTFTGLKQ